MSESEPPVISYASGSQRERFHVVDFLFPFIATIMFVGMILLPIPGIRSAKSLCEALRLEVHGTTQLTFDFYDLLIDIRANYWLWAMPAIVPFVLMRFRREVRYRLLLLAILLGGLVGLISILSAWQMWESVMIGMTSKK